MSATDCRNMPLSSLLSKTERGLLLLFLLLSLTASAQQPVMDRLQDWLPDTLSPQGSMQGMALHGRYAVTLRHGGQCLIFDLRRHRCVASFFLEGNATHCNNASFSRLRLSRRDPFPLLYISSCYGDKACLVTRLTLTGSQIVQRIYFDSPAFPVAQDWCLDADSGFLYAYGGRMGGTMYLKKFPLPALDSAEVHLTEEDVLHTIPVTCVKVAQGSKVKGRRAYLPDGNESGHYWLHVLDMESGRELRTLDLNAVDMEPEGVDVRGRWLYLSFHSPNPLHNKILRFRR
ncbi:MAG: hypothetical protein MJZ45_04560 [Bacteroidales bacterium]|nr:hypothetical protein [Bacteroidales bacterium]